MENINTDKHTPSLSEDKDTLQTRYRPHTWDNIIGQEHILSILKGIIKNQTYRFTRSYIISGAAGSGKTSSMRVFSNAIICDHPEPQHRPCLNCKSCNDYQNNNYGDYIEVDAGQYNKVEDVAKLIDIAKTYPINPQKFRLILVDEAHRLSNAAWDSLLKLLEEGRTKTIFMFATTEGDKIRRAIHSRSIAFQVKPLSVQEIQKELIRVCNLEHIVYDNKSIQSIAYANRGRMRDALKTLDMLHRAHREVVNIQLTTPEENICDVLTHAYFNRQDKATDLLNTLTTDPANIGHNLCSTITALYCYPQQQTSGIPEYKLSETKSLLKQDIKKLIELYMQYKPETYEQVKLFLYLVAELGVSKLKQTDKQTQKRQLIRVRDKPQQSEDYDF